MSKKVTSLSSEILSKLIVKGMQERKAIDIHILDLRKVKNSVADYFVLCTGTSDTHMSGISESVKDEVMKASGQMPWHKEGGDNKSWVLLDYVDVVTHIFAEDSRSFYGIEDLWADAEIEILKDPAQKN